MQSGPRKEMQSVGTFDNFFTSLNVLTYFSVPLIWCPFIDQTFEKSNGWVVVGYDLN